jgi:hypothetical protein
MNENLTDEMLKDIILPLLPKPVDLIDPVQD